LSDHATILFTGGSGLLGTAMRKRLPEALFPGADEFDVTDPKGMEAWARSREIAQVVHAAAFTSPPRIDQDPVQALDVNIVGTANVVRFCHARKARLVYVSTDYVFRGDRGRYSEEDALHPVNKYAWSKLGGECAVRLYDRGLIVRTSFSPDVFPYEKAFVDQWTSREGVSVVAEKIARLVRSDVTGVVHVGGARRTVMEFAKSLDASRRIGDLSIHDVAFTVPVDTSLDCKRYEDLVGGACHKEERT
jgi:dTDP-4-dehydrorhamnose reductase